MWAIPTGIRCQLAFKKKKIQVKSPSPESRVPETGSDPPIGSARDSGRDKYAGKQSAQEMQGVVSQGEDEVLVLPSVPTARQLINSQSIIENQVNNWTPKTLKSAQATAGVEEIILLDPP